MKPNENHRVTNCEGAFRKYTKKKSDQVMSSTCLLFFHFREFNITICLHTCLSGCFVFSSFSSGGCEWLSEHKWLRGKQVKQKKGCGGGGGMSCVYWMLVLLLLLRCFFIQTRKSALQLQ